MKTFHQWLEQAAGPGGGMAPIPGGVPRTSAQTPRQADPNDPGDQDVAATTAKLKKDVGEQSDRDIRGAVNKARTILGPEGEELNTPATALLNALAQKTQQMQMQMQTPTK